MVYITINKSQLFLLIVYDFYYNLHINIHFSHINIQMHDGKMNADHYV